MNNYKIKTLWIDDEPNDDFIDFAFDEYDIDIEIATCHEDGMLKLKDPFQNWDAVILDANCKRTNNIHEAPSLNSLTDSIHEISEFCSSFNKKIPWFVYTGGGYKAFENLNIMIHSKRFWDDRDYYNKPKDMKVLFENIKKAVENSDEWKIKVDYNSVFEIFKIENTFNELGYIENSILLKLLLAKDSIKESINPDHLNIIRKFIAGGVMKTLTNMGVIPVSIDKLNAKSYHLGQSRFSESIPIHVQRAFHSIISTCQDGSHSEKESVDEKIPPQIDKLVREGNAPYLLSSLVFEVLNILIWLKDFMVSHNDKEQNLINFKKIEKV